MGATSALRTAAASWLGADGRRWLRADLLAAVTVTAYLVPQVMAYAELAGLPAQAGLWAALGALGLYAIVGSSPLLSVGPESTTALLTAAAIASAPAGREDPASFASVLALTVAAVCALAWAARLSVLADLLSRPVLVGYLAGVGVAMVLSQLGRLTGIRGAGPSSWDRVSHTAQHLDEVHVATVVLGLGTLTAMLVVSAVLPRAPTALLGLVGASAAASLLGLADQGVGVVGAIPGGLPVPGIPEVDAELLVAALVPALGIAVVGYSDNVLTARAFAQEGDPRVDPRRELLGLGLANLGAALMRGFPVSSSGSRTAIAHSMGARTRATGLLTLACTAIAVVAFRPVLESFPSAALGAVVVYAAIELIRVQEFQRLARFRSSELVIALTTAAAVAAVGVLQAVLVAIGLSVLDLLRRVARPHDAVLGYVDGVAGMHDVAVHPEARVVEGLVVYRYDSPLFFANAEDFRTRALDAVGHRGGGAPVRWLLVNAEAISDVDGTAVDALDSLRTELGARGIVLALARVEHEVRLLLDRAGFIDRIGSDHVFPTLPTAVDAYLTAQPASGATSAVPRGTPTSPRCTAPTPPARTPDPVRRP